MAVLISGSIAYDRIMDFPGKFSDHILPKKIHNINVSFGLERLAVRFGGTAGNIAYTLSLFGVRPTIISQMGFDGADYRRRFTQRHIDQRTIRHVRTEHCSTAHIITDRANNQIAAFHFGAMRYPATATQHVQRVLKRLVVEQSCIGLLAAGNIKDMLWCTQLYRTAKVPYIADPGQQITAMTTPQLQAIVRRAHTLIVNDYEWALVQKKLKASARAIRRMVTRVIVTLGEHGAKWYTPTAEKHMPIARLRKNVDPTGAGDAYRAGVILGMLKQWPDDVAGRVAALCATYAIECYGTQCHAFTHQQFKKRFTQAFGKPLTFSL